MATTARLLIPLLVVAQEHKEVSINNALNTFDAACVLLTEANVFTAAVTFSLSGAAVTFGEGSNVVLGTGTGTKLGTSASQKLGFFNATPIVQPANTADLRAAIINLGLLASGGATPLDLNGGGLTATGANSLGATAFSGDVTNTGANYYSTRAPQATANYANVSIGNGGFAGSSGHFLGAAAGALLGINLASGGTADLFNAQVNGVSKVNLNSSGNLVLGDAVNVVLNTSTGTKIGTTTSQKLGFFNATPVVQPVGTTDLRAAMINLGLLASGGATPLDLNGGALTATGTNSLGATTFSSDVTLSTHNIVTDTSTGTKIGTATTQKLAFFNSTPIAQPGNTTDLRTAIINLGLLASGGATPLNLNGGTLTAADVVGAPMGRVMVLCAAFTPAATGVDSAEFVVPYSPRDGTTSVTWNVRRIVLRVGTAGGAPVVVIEKSTAGDAVFGTGTAVGTLTMVSGHNLITNTTSLGTVASGDYLRFNVTTLGSATNWTIEVELGATS